MGLAGKFAICAGLFALSVPAMPGDPVAPRPAAGPTLVQKNWFVVESGAVAFGDLVPGVARELPAAVRVRVFADGGWALRLVPETPLRVVGGNSDFVPYSRISWRSRLSGHYVSFTSGQGAIVARGAATGPAGQLAVTDLRMQLEDNDDLGRFTCQFRIVLETL